MAARVSFRAKDVGYEWKAKGVPAEFVSLSGKLGAKPPRRRGATLAAA